jgi:hypothetical protein
VQVSLALNFFMSDYLLFRYNAINKNFLDSLVKSELYFARRDELNDPFDCNVDISRAANKLIAQGIKTDLLEKFCKGDYGLDMFNRNIEPFYTCSFSLAVNQTLMWSHYAENHKGVCLRYDFPETFSDNEDEIIDVSKVSYEPNAITKWLTDNINLFDTDHKKFIINLLKTLLLSKAPLWAYEKETRIICSINGLFEIPRETLTRVTFGLQTTKADKSLIRSIINKYYSDVKFAEVIRTDDDFGIDTKEI